uniref:FAD synthase n=1 Tax=Herpetomonas muscarum TaxID=5718 RepID=T1YTE8_HERMU|nr:FAD synthetase [Herpetomonas muscarum]
MADTPSLTNSEARAYAEDELTSIATKLSSTLTEDVANRAPLERAALVVAQTAEAFPPESIAITFNGGKDAVVILELLIRQMGEAWVRRCCILVLVEKGSEFVELAQFRQSYFATRLPGAVLHEVPSPDGMREGLWRAWEEFHFAAAFMGTRKDDPSGKYQETPWKMTTAGWAPMVRVCPILSWTFKDVWDYIKSNRIPYCCLYENGYTSLGDSSVTSPNTLLRKEDGSYHPAWMLESHHLERAGRAEQSPLP